MTGYVEWVLGHPFASAFIQFALLGTLGELMSHWIVHRRLALPCSPVQLVLKVMAWGVLGWLVKIGFTGMKGFTRALVDHHVLPDAFGYGIGWAFALSVLTNIFFGPQLMFFHRFEDNLIMRQNNYSGMAAALKTLIYFWIPAHTLTFYLPTPYQIGLAALWGTVLGLILGWAKRKCHAQILNPIGACH